jgi:hypothetical protein
MFRLIVFQFDHFFSTGPLGYSYSDATVESFRFDNH